MDLSSLVIVIPAYEPNHLLTDLLVKFDEIFFESKIVVVNDGSKHADETLKEVVKHKNVILLNHEVNKGKGAALKTAFDYIYHNFENKIIVTADADGQHKPEDILKVAMVFDELRYGVVLGSREFDGKVPFRSRFGNDATKLLYRLCNGKALQDNQTGLRAFGSDLLKFMLSVKGDRYEYEMNMLMECVRQDIAVNEVGIETVYINNNESSHFNPVKDFLKICRNILKYAIPTIFCIVFDVCIFFLSYYLLKNLSLKPELLIIICCLISSTFSCIIHSLIHKFGLFYGNKHLSKSPYKKRKYIIEAILVIILNFTGLFSFYYFLENIIPAKILGSIDLYIVLLLINYFIAPKPKLR